MRWHVDPLGEFYNCNEATVVYFDSASGDTHLLSESAAWLLSILAEQPMDVDELIARATAYRFNNSSFVIAQVPLLLSLV